MIFNITPQELLDGGWCDEFRAKIIHPNTLTTISTFINRPIDFGIISTSIECMYITTHPVYTVPFGPHYGLVSEFCAKPRSIQGLVQYMPRALPIEEFNYECACLNCTQIKNIQDTANKLARQM